MDRAQATQFIKQMVDRIFAERKKRQELDAVSRLQRTISELADAARSQGFPVGEARANIGKAERVRSAQAKLAAFDQFHKENPSNRIWGDPRVKMDRQQLKRELIEAQTGETPIWSHLV